MATAIPPTESERACFAMIEFLEAAWKRGDGITVADVLSAISFLPDGTTFDPAYSNDWESAWAKSEGKTKADYRFSITR